VDFPDERVAEVAKLGPVQASELLARGRAGDLQALADWTVYAVHRAVLKLGATPPQALYHTRVVIRRTDLRVKAVL
jgi:hypothetical protein